MSPDFTHMPLDLPVPDDDGSADHLSGLAIPSLSLRSTLSGSTNLANLAQGRLVVYVYPRTGKPGQASPAGWDDIPGARGCTPQSCAYRDSLAAFEQVGATVIGVSTQSTADQLEFAQREHIPFPLLSDPGLELARKLALPTFEAAGLTLYRRLTLIADSGTIAKVFYPVFPPDRDAAQVLAWLATHLPRPGQMSN